MAKILGDIFPNGLTLADLTPPAPLAPEHQLRVAMSDAGLTPPDDIVLDGVLRRFSTNGRAKDSSGWYVAFDDGKGPAGGAFGDWRQGLESTWRADIGRELSTIEQMAHAARMRELKAQREREIAAIRADASENAATLWSDAPLASDEHPYIQRKGISNPGLRVAPDGRLMAPMFVGTELASLQYIDGDGVKRFLKGGKTGGAWWAIGGALSSECKRVYLAEGVATAASVFEATGKPVAVAFSASNMTLTAQALRSLVGIACEVVIVADNDESGTGQREAEKAAQAVGARVWMPPVTGDANDYAQAGNDLAMELEPVSQASQGRYRLVPAHQMTNLPAVRWQIKKVLPARDVVAIYGAPGAGKSFMALDMAVHISNGDDWHGYRTKKATVVYVVLEAANGFSGRLKAWETHHAHALPDNFHVVAHTSFALSSPKDIQDLMDAIRAVVGEDHGGLVVFIDTLARAMGTFEENDNNDMGRVIQSADAMCRALQCTVCLVAHPGKDSAKGLRGGSALLGGLDTVIQLEKDDSGLRTWKLEKQKEGEDGLTGAFRLHVVPVGHDEDGDEITSAVVELSEEVAETQQIEPNGLGVYRQYFEAAVIAFGRFDSKLNAPFISADGLVDYSKTTKKETDGARKTYLSRVKKELLKAGYIQEENGGYSATNHPSMEGAWINLQKF